MITITFLSVQNIFLLMKLMPEKKPFWYFPFKHCVWSFQFIKFDEITFSNYRFELIQNRTEYSN